MARRGADNRSVFKIKGLNQEKLINKLIKSANIYNFKRESHNICLFETDCSQSKQVKAMLLENGVQIISCSHRGFWARLKKIITSYGIISAIILSTLFYSLQYSLIWRIEVYGESNVDEVAVENYLNEILPSRFKYQIKTKELESKIKENFKQISSVSIAIIGQSLVLNLNEAILPEEMEGVYQPLVSQFDGLITEINLIQGTLAVNEGGLVRKGDVLVYPYIVDSQGNERACLPKAEIIADVWISQSVMHYDYQILSRRTGRKKEFSDVYLNDLLIYSNKKDHGFQEYEFEQIEVFLTKNLIFPFILRKTIYYETEIVEIKQNFSEEKDKIISALREKALIFVEENEIIKEENYTIREEGGCREVCYVITVNRNIGG